MVYLPLPNQLVQVDVKDDKGCTPCLMAALNGHLKSVELLVDEFKAKARAFFFRCLVCALG